MKFLIYFVVFRTDDGDKFWESPQQKEFLTKLRVLDRSLLYVVKIRFFRSVLLLYFENNVYFGITSYFNSGWISYIDPRCGFTVDCLMKLLTTRKVPSASIDLSTADEVVRTDKDVPEVFLRLLYHELVNNQRWPFEVMVSSRQFAEFIRKVNLLELQKFKARVAESTTGVFIPYIEWYSVENRYGVMDSAVSQEGCPPEMVLTSRKVSRSCCGA